MTKYLKYTNVKSIWVVQNINDLAYNNIQIKQKVPTPHTNPQYSIILYYYTYTQTRY